jgi:Tfp pilus assembly protein PilE
MFSLDDIFDFLRRNLFLVLGVLVFIVRSYGQYVESSKKAQLENQRKLETAQQQERAQGYEGYLERTSATKLDDGRDDFSQTGTHNGPRPTPQQNARGFDDLARDLQQARTQTKPTSDPQTELRRLLEEKMGRAPKTANTSNQSNPNSSAPPSIGRPSSKPPPSKRPTTSRAFEPDRTAASTFMPSSVTTPKSLEENRVIEASFERSLNKSKLEQKTMDTTPKARVISGTTFSSQDAVRAVIWSEVLGAPKSRRR